MAAAENKLADISLANKRKRMNDDRQKEKDLEESEQPIIKIINEWLEDTAEQLLSSTHWNKEISEIRRRLEKGSASTSFVLARYEKGDIYPCCRDKYKSPKGLGHFPSITLMIYCGSHDFDILLNKPGHFLDSCHLKLYPLIALQHGSHGSPYIVAAALVISLNAKIDEEPVGLTFMNEYCVIL